MEYLSDINLQNKTSRPIIPLTSLEARYRLISDLGVGGFGTVVLAEYKKNKQYLLKLDKCKKGTLLDPLVDSQKHLNGIVAIKTLKTKMTCVQDYIRGKELEFILAIPSHPNLVQIYEIFVNKVTFELHISMEPLSLNLYQLMRSRCYKFSLETLKSILTQLLNGIRHIHRHNYFHRDIKPQNILVIPTLQYYGSKESIPNDKRRDNYIIKLADYGLSRSVYDLRKYTEYISTRWYRSPEILLRRNWYSKPVDIWAFGVIAVEVANLFPLFPGNSEAEQISRINEVLGTPLPLYSPLSLFNYLPLGGYWKEAYSLAQKRGFSFHYSSGLQIYDLLPDSRLLQLAEVVKLCLTWNPDVRPDVETLCTMSYFQNTVVSSPYQDPKRVADNLDKLSSLSEREIANRFNIITRDQNFKERKKNYSDKIYHVPLKSPLSHTMVNVHQQSVGHNYDDFADGYENEFMKPYMYDNISSAKIENALLSPNEGICRSCENNIKNSSFTYYENEYQYLNNDQIEQLFSDDTRNLDANQTICNSLWNISETHKVSQLNPIKNMDESLLVTGDNMFGNELRC